MLMLNFTAYIWGLNQEGHEFGFDILDSASPVYVLLLPGNVLVRFECSTSFLVTKK